MEEQNSYSNKQPATISNDHGSPAFYMIVVMMLAVVAASAIFLIRYRPAPAVVQPPITLEEKIAHLETGAPLPGQATRPDVPRWMVAPSRITTLLPIRV